jgi:hypothetical protein
MLPLRSPRMMTKTARARSSRSCARDEGVVLGTTRVPPVTGRIGRCTRPFYMDLRLARTCSPRRPWSNRRCTRHGFCVVRSVQAYIAAESNRCVLKMRAGCSSRFHRK